MKKSLLALAVLGAFAGVANAQTNVTVYGIVDAGVAYDNGASAAGKTWKLQSGQQSGSRLGFKGTEDLGGGLSAIFTLENGFTVDDGQASTSLGGRLFGRQAWVGLKGSFGEVKLGRQQTPLYYAVAAVDPFGIGLAGNAQRAFGYGMYGQDPLARTDNTISYAISNSGFNAGLNYSFGEQAGDNNKNRNIGVALGYANGPLNVQFAYQKSNNATLLPNGTASAQFLDLTGVDGLNTTTAETLKAAFIGATYDFGVAKAHAAYADNKLEVTGGEVKNRDLMLGVSAPVGAAGTVMASWIRNDFKSSDDKSNQYAIGYTHNLSKRTNLYTSFAYTKNDAGVLLNSAEAGTSDRLLNVGVRHAF
ncbi:porin [Noviherbaspirillum sp. UKPF54]|uniref:porin n=1 Tax=Noviherbaspirillum sp. UKPF54 TaxID=2601898 RepID=UPI0011B139EB|nr:porin [Noviherbaspirillum sp. UKPF54]QDZ30293.1 porin [Noviherbaspirillum sp. UKPF54]